MKHFRQIAHEAVSSDTIEVGSDRSFGYVMFAALSILVLVFWLKFGLSIALTLSALSFPLLFLILAITKPKLLHPANVLWMKFAHLLHRIISPVILALLFYGAFTPTALWIKLTGKDPLRLSRHPNTKSYWIHCQDETSNLKKQF